MQPEVIVWNGQEWLAPPLLAGARLLRGANAAAVLDFTVVKNGNLDFVEGAPVCLLAAGEILFKGRVFRKSRQQPELISVRAYDQLRYLQNRDCCVFTNMTLGGMVKRICAENGLTTGLIADNGCPLAPHSFDNRRYIDMLTEVLQEVLQDQGRHYFIYDQAGEVCLQSCWDLRVNICLAASCLGGYTYNTSIDENVYNRVKVIYEDKRKGARRQFVAQNSQRLADWGPLQLVSKNADAKEQTYNKARQLLEQHCRRQESLEVYGVPGDLRVRGGSMVGVRLNLGDQLVDSWAIIKRAEHTFTGNNCLMDLSLLIGEEV